MGGCGVYIFLTAMSVISAATLFSRDRVHARVGISFTPTCSELMREKEFVVSVPPPRQKRYQPFLVNLLLLLEQVQRQL